MASLIHRPRMQCKVGVAHTLLGSYQQNKYRIKGNIIVEYQNLHKTLMKKQHRLLLISMCTGVALWLL